MIKNNLAQILSLRVFRWLLYGLYKHGTYYTGIRINGILNDVCSKCAQMFWTMEKKVMLLIKFTVGCSFNANELS